MPSELVELYRCVDGQPADCDSASAGGSSAELLVPGFRLLRLEEVPSPFSLPPWTGTQALRLLPRPRQRLDLLTLLTCWGDCAEGRWRRICRRASGSPARPTGTAPFPPPRRCRPLLKLLRREVELPLTDVRGSQRYTVRFVVPPAVEAKAEAEAEAGGGEGGGGEAGADASAARGAGEQAVEADMERPAVVVAVWLRGRIGDGQERAPSLAAFLQGCARN